MKEIGGYFEIDSLTGGTGEFYGDLIPLNTARNALVYLIKAKAVNKLYIPYLLCDSVSLVCEREGFSYEYYHTDSALRPLFNKALGENEYLYVVNYYGQISNDEICDFKKRYGQVIVDNTQAFFHKPVNGVDTIYSCRKFFGVPDGAYLATDSVLSEKLPVDNSANRTGHIYGRAKEGATAHYAEFKLNDAQFKQLPLMKMSELTHKMLSEIDYERIREKREENYACLHGQLGGINKLKLCIPKGSYAYPFYCKNGIEVRNKLAEKKIYVATLWPNVLRLDGTTEKDCAENILPLPCDQRYGIDDMQLIVEELQYE